MKRRRFKNLEEELEALEADPRARALLSEIQGLPEDRAAILVRDLEQAADQEEKDQWDTSDK